MKKIVSRKYKIHFLVLASIFMITACDEEVHLIEEVKEAPVIASFEPKSGEAGTFIHLEGEYLKNIDTVSVGGGEAIIFRVINDLEAILQITHASSSGKIVVGNSIGSIQAADDFTMLYSTPEVTEFPETGVINSDVSFTGSNMNAITKVFFNDAEAQIMYQSKDELAVKVPFVLADWATVYLKYNDESGEQSIKGKSYGFRMVKPEFSVDVWPTAALSGAEISLLGENINLADSVFFGDQLAEVVSSSPSFITVRVPEFEERTFVTMRVVYFVESEIINTFQTEVYTRFRKVLSTFEAGTDNFLVDEKYASPDQIVINGDDSLSAPEGSYYVHFSHPPAPEITSSVVSYFHYDEGEDNLINLKAFDDPVLHFYYTNKGTPSYLQLQVLVGGVKWRLYVERYRTEDEWGLYCIRLNEAMFKDAWTAPIRTNLDYNSYEYIRLNYKADADEDILVNMDYVFVSEGALKGAIDLTKYNKEDDYIIEIVE